MRRLADNKGVKDPVLFECLPNGSRDKMVLRRIPVWVTTQSQCLVNSLAKPQPVSAVKANAFRPHPENAHIGILCGDLVETRFELRGTTPFAQVMDHKQNRDAAIMPGFRHRSPPAHRPATHRTASRHAVAVT